jgi:hypothetical protein
MPAAESPKSPESAGTGSTVIPYFSSSRVSFGPSVAATTWFPWRFSVLRPSLRRVWKVMGLLKFPKKGKKRNRG